MLYSTRLAGTALLFLFMQSPAAGAVPVRAGAPSSPDGWTFSPPYSAALPIAPFQAERKVTGVVTDDTGTPIPGVNIQIKGTTKGVQTTPDGRFTIAVPDDNTILVFSFIGMVTREIAVGKQVALKIALTPSSTTLNEVVAVGYGSQKKESVVGAISQVSNKELKRTGNVPDLREALVGQVPGLVGLTSSGEPGGILTGESATNLFIRGQTTWNGAQPLVLVDGIKRNMNDIDVNDVASISVLKDASATAVFGVEGANGVILITTKRGKAGKTSLNFNYVGTAKMLSKQPATLDSYAALVARNEIIEREGVLNESSWNDYMPYNIVQRYQKPQTAEYQQIYANVDWQDALYDDVGFSHKATLSASGGSKTIQYFGSLTYLHEGDMFKFYDNGKGYEPNYNFDRFNFRSNIDINLTKTTVFRLGLSGFYSLKNTNFNNEGSTGRGDAWMWRATYGLAPDLFLPMYPNGRWGANQEGGNNTLNPAAVVYNLGIRETRATQLLSDFVIEQNLDFITKGLSARALLSSDNNIRSEGGIYDIQNSVRPAEARTNVAFQQIYPLLYEGPDQDPSEYTVMLPVNDEEYDWVLQPWTIRQEDIIAANWASYIPIDRRLTYQGQLNYTRKFGAHDVTAMGLFKREEYARGSMFKNYREDWAFRATYNYKLRYFVEGNGAYNGSEQFGPGYRFHFFPSVAVGWYISNEKFFKVKWIDKLKLRANTGTIGNDDVGGGRWLYASAYATGGRARLTEKTDGQSPYNFYRTSVVGNPDIHWETAQKTNYGLELDMFRQLISINFDYYTQDRTDILLGGTSRSVPPFFGMTPPSANLGRVKSNGFEVEVRINKELNKDLLLWSNVSVTHNRNTVIFRDDPPLQYDYLKAAGYPIGQQRSLVKSKIYQNWDDVYASVPTENNDMQKLPGYYDLMDMNADGIIKNSDDVVPVGYSEVPQNTAVVTLGTNWKDFSFLVSFYGVNNASRVINFPNFQNYTNILYGDGNYWSKDNPNSGVFLPRWRTQAENIGDYYLYDASYIRLRTVEFAYDFNSRYSWIKQVGINSMRLYLNGNNLFFWSKLPDDRQGSYSGGNATEGAYPTVKRINLGIELSF
ncbi:SusC/RagA family TonB-linked outer membrane protein [Chitinophaga sp. GCM10012297]|uniref:TonB-dependent receptor n=1 Tax=Chitinophaga chungangae TaxID=2821488 RepID=A0ABS3YJ56_9BACT|nr:TonB-dependent receptor [Chitinophaga chungangae]MBO9154723.1 TonB-dependent receptor [Chitinophaga chungangae]